MKSFEYSKQGVKTEKIQAKPISGEEISNDYHGDAADVTLVDFDIGSKQRSFVIKEYDQSYAQTDDVESAKEYARHSVEVWSLLRDLQFPTYPTYRLEKDGTSILMTDLAAGGAVALSSTNAPVEWCTEGGEYEKKIKHISNFQEVLYDVKQIAKKGARHRIELQPDVYFLLATESREGEYSLTAFLGDFESVELDQAVDAIFEKLNIAAAGFMIWQNIENFVVADQQTFYKEQILKFFPEIKEEYSFVN